MKTEPSQIALEYAQHYLTTGQSQFEAFTPGQGSEIVELNGRVLRVSGADHRIMVVDVGPHWADDDTPEMAEIRRKLEQSFNEDLAESSGLGRFAGLDERGNVVDMRQYPAAKPLLPNTQIG